MNVAPSGHLCGTAPQFIFFGLSIKLHCNPGAATFLSVCGSSAFLIATCTSSLVQTFFNARTCSPESIITCVSSTASDHNARHSHVVLQIRAGMFLPTCGRDFAPETADETTTCCARTQCFRSFRPGLAPCIDGLRPALQCRAKTSALPLLAG